MRKYTSLFIILTLLLTVVLPVQAATEVYRLPELGLSVSIPSGYDVFTLDMRANDPLFSEYGITKADLTAELTAGNIYLDALSADGSNELLITMTENTISSFDGLSDTLLLSMISVLEDEYANYGFTVTESEIYHHPQLTFAVLTFHDTARTTYVRQYYTIYDYMAVNFTLRSYSGALSSAQEETLLSVVDSIALDSYTAPVTENTPSFLYTDADSGVSFTVPADWETEPLSKDREYIDVKFASTQESGLVMMYGSSDLWSQLSSTERLGLRRSDIDNSILTKADVAEMLGSSSAVEIKTYNGKDYYFAEITSNTDAYGFSMSINMTNVIRIENGWMYWFQFGGKSDNPRFEDFEQMICSVSYPASDAPATIPATEVPTVSPATEATTAPPISEAPTAVPASNPPTAASAPDASPASPAIWIIIGIPVIVIAAVIVAVLLKKKKAAALRQTSYHGTSFPSAPCPIPAGSTVLCPACGARLPSDSAFCHICGTRIVVKES